MMNDFENKVVYTIKRDEFDDFRDFEKIKQNMYDYEGMDLILDHHGITVDVQKDCFTIKRELEETSDFYYRLKDGRLLKFFKDTIRMSEYTSSRRGHFRIIHVVLTRPQFVAEDKTPEYISIIEKNLVDHPLEFFTLAEIGGDNHPVLVEKKVYITREDAQAECDRLRGRGMNIEVVSLNYM